MDMEKEIVDKEKAINDLRKIFNIDDSKVSICKGSGFLIAKDDFIREEVIAKLIEYFDKHKIENHHVRVSPITLFWTSFEIASNDDIGVQ